MQHHSERSFSGIHALPGHFSNYVELKKYIYCRRERERETERETERDTERERHTHTHTQRERERINDCKRLCIAPKMIYFIW